MARAPEQVAPGVYRVDTTGIPNAISVLLVADDDGWMLVDAGLRGGALRVQEALSALGAGPGDLRRIYLTHQHDDHIGGLPAIRWWATEAEVVASEHEARVISGGVPPTRHRTRSCASLLGGRSYPRYRSTASCGRAIASLAFA